MRWMHQTPNRAMRRLFSFTVWKPVSLLGDTLLGKSLMGDPSRRYGSSVDVVLCCGPCYCHCLGVLNGNDL